MKRKLICLSLILLLAFALACGKNAAAPEETPAPTPEVTPEVPVVIMDSLPVHSDTPEDIANEQVEPPTPTPFQISCTTGRDSSMEKGFKPVLVCYENAFSGRPLSGIAEADVVYEAPRDHDGTGTRLLAVFNDVLPAQVGPVGEARAYFTELQQEWNGVFAYAGYPTEADYPALADASIRVRAAADGDAKAYFSTPKDLNGQFAALDRMAEGLFGDAIPEQIRFLFSEGYAYENDSSAKKLRVSFGGTPSEMTEYTYDEGRRAYRRRQADADGKMQDFDSLSADAETGALAAVPVYVTNIIVQYVKIGELADGYRSLELVGSGRCEYFTGGRRVSGTWACEAAGTPTLYCTMDGSVMTLQPGTTWIAFVSGPNMITT